MKAHQMGSCELGGGVEFALTIAGVSIAKTKARTRLEEELQCLKQILK